MIYVIAMLGNDNVRIFNTDAKEYKDLSLSILKSALANGMEIENAGLNSAGTVVIKGGRERYPRFELDAKDKKWKLVTSNILTVISHTDAGKTAVVDANGEVNTYFTTALKSMKLSNASFTVDDRLEGFFDVTDYKSFLGQFTGSMAIFGFGLAHGGEDYKLNGTQWEYTGEKKTSTITIPDGVTDIKIGSLNGVTVTTLELPSTLTKLSRGQLQGVFAQNVYIPAGNLQQIGNQAFYDTKIRELKILGQPGIHPMAFYGGRISKILAQGRVYKDCLSYKPSPLTVVKPFRA
jgi:hypothetical protein